MIGRYPLVFSLVAVMGTALGAAERVTLTGVISDELCAAKHAMINTSSADCTHECVKHGADYVLVVKDKVYTLKADNTRAEADLDALAGQSVTITGEPEADFIWVLTVAAAK